ncbi:MAG: hypothetical protein M1821_004818 [Bathelium mastoideum]|nr:MAG: hypothetical protein M1821_004818 [Bathelium mastoideum]KAI9692229.1 MAG: hypothetical protein M1822_006459 [Bathelium mastoideum]
MPSSASITDITSPTQLTTLLTTHALVVADFHASWCQPCHAIAPLFASLATTHAQPHRLAFVKIDVDAHQALARQYSVSAMPTFLVIKRGGRVGDTVRGADPGRLRAMVERAAKEAREAAGGSAGGAGFGGAGRTLGASGQGGAASSSRSVGGEAGWQALVRKLGSETAGRAGRGGEGWGDVLVRFLVLYFTSLFSLVPAEAVQASPFSVKNKGR